VIRPANLKHGDQIGIVAPSNSIDRIYIEKATAIFEGWGLKVIPAGNIYDSYFQFAGSDSQRLESLQVMFDSSEIKAILCARGGYGLTRIIDGLTLKNFIRFPKWVAGFSDVTVLLAKILNAGIECIHGPMALTFDQVADPDGISNLRKILFGEEIKPYEINPHALNRTGSAEGILSGGNLSLLCNSIGTETDLSTRGRILFLEETDEYLYRIDRMAGQLARTGKFESLAGLIIGHMSNIKENDKPFDRSVLDIFGNYAAPYQYPVCFNAPAGHSYPNFPLPFGRTVKLTVSPGSVNLSI
jgi:muramoyltetrapeptide carboxypeptidase